MVRVSGREYNALLESPCHQRGAMTCLSCHSMHKSDPDGQLARAGDGDAACTQCHRAIGDNVAAHTHHRADSSGSTCYNCHMPHTTYGLLRAMSSHQVTVPRVQDTTEAGRPNACNLCHLDKTLAWWRQWSTQAHLEGPDGPGAIRSAITLKAELTRRLVGVNPERARDELADLLDHLAVDLDPKHRPVERAWVQLISPFDADDKELDQMSEHDAALERTSRRTAG